jgi:hypothetical protein
MANVVVAVVDFDFDAAIGIGAAELAQNRRMEGDSALNFTRIIRLAQ